MCQSIFRKVGPKFLYYLLGHTVLLCLNERLQHASYSDLDILFCDLAAQINLGVGDRQSNNGLDVSNCYVHSPCEFTFLSEFNIKLLDQSSVFLWQLWSAPLASVLDVFLQKQNVNFGLTVSSLGQVSVVYQKLIFIGMVFHVRVYHKSAQMIVDLRVGLVSNYCQNVKSW